MEDIDLQTVLQLCDQWALGHEGKELALDGERHWHDQAHEDDHLGHQKEEDLYVLVSMKSSMDSMVQRTRL